MIVLLYIAYVVCAGGYLIGLATKNKLACILCTVCLVIVVVAICNHGSVQEAYSHCEVCKKSYSIDYRYCPMDGTLLSVTKSKED